jgi:peptide-methionine (S)-S-oxide reductase
MKNIRIKTITIAGIFQIAGALSLAFATGKSEPMDEMNQETKIDISFEGAETAVFAGGCFWGVEGVFERLKGVANVESGYAGGSADTAHYKIVGTGTTGHAESVRILYDPNYISYETLLEVFFSVAHDPTQYNYQGPDVGTEYRSAVFYLNDKQKEETEKYIMELENKDVYKQPIVTEVAALDEFYPAEDYHQDFMRLNPTHPYIEYWDVPKVKDLEKKFPELITKK